jgi:hypothetical protein
MKPWLPISERLARYLLRAAWVSARAVVYASTKSCTLPLIVPHGAQNG